MSREFDLSIVLPTCNRAALLENALAAIAATTSCYHEIVVVDGASTDETSEVLERAREELGDRLQVIREEKREGFVKGTNKGFRAARGRNMTWLNDDARPFPEALDRAVQQIDSEPADVAFVAMFHQWHSARNVAYETKVDGQLFRLCHIRGTLYANFPVGRRATYEKLDYFDERYYVQAADPDLSLKAWHAGMRIVPAYGAIVDHDEHLDARRAADHPLASTDNVKLFAKWDLPAKNLLFNDFDPMRPCTLRGMRDGAMAEAQAA
jgi:GT2 family glycosyltransferase